jgi:hypothetical protein
MLINARAANRISYSRLRPSHLLAIAEEHAKMVSSAADSSASPTFLAEKDKVPLYIRNPELDELLLFRVLEELHQALSDALDRFRRKSSLHIHVLTERIDLLLMRNRRTI